MPDATSYNTAWCGGGKAMGPLWSFGLIVATRRLHRRASFAARCVLDAMFGHGPYSFGNSRAAPAGGELFDQHHQQERNPAWDHRRSSEKRSSKQGFGKSPTIWILAY